MVVIKSPEEVNIMKEGGLIARKALDTAIRNARVGMTTLELNNIAEEVILKEGGYPCFKGYEGFPFATCINVNHGIVHGLPNDYVLKKGDLVSIDLGVLYKGLTTDVSETFELGSNTHKGFLETGRKALTAAISKCKVGNRVGDISFAIQSIIERAGYSVSRDLSGHGVGKSIHEDPYVLCYGNPGEGLELVEGMTLAIEVIYQKGKPDLVLEPDGWTLSTKDGSLSGLFERTVAVGSKTPLVLT